MEWKHILDVQPQTDRNIVQCDREYLGHYCMGMRLYTQYGNWEEYMEWCKARDCFPDFWWVYAEDFPFPKQDPKCERELRTIQAEKKKECKA
jgi:hypothetical protein